MTDINYEGRELTIGDETITLRHKIGQVMEADGTILVLLSPTQAEGRDRRNLLAFDQNGNKLWESEIPDKSDRHMFGDIRKKDGDIIGWSWNNHVYKIDLETGELEELRFVGK